MDQFLGQHPTGRCGWYQVALTGAAAYTNINGTNAVLVAGGDGQLHALNANNGNQIWGSQIENINGGEYVWGSVVVALGSIYVGISAFDDCSGANGKVLRISPNGGGVLNTFTVGSGNCVGGGIWGTPTVDAATGQVFVATGNPLVVNNAVCATPNMQAVVALNANNLNVISSWTVPPSQLNNPDSDFGGTPTLFPATVNGTPRLMLGVVNKNGYYYAFNRQNIGAGPLWYTQIANGGNDPQGGQGSIVTSGYDGQRIYIAGGRTNSCNGTLRAIDPSSGNILWTACLDNTDLGAVTATGNAVFTTYGNKIGGFNAATGQQFFTYQGQATFYAAVTILPNHLYVGDTHGNLYAFSW